MLAVRIVPRATARGATARAPISLACVARRKLATAASFPEPSWVTLASRLDAELSERVVPKLVPQDHSQVMGILGAMCGKERRPHETLWKQTADGVLRPHPVKCNLVAHFFVARFFDGQSLQIRAHVIDRASEDNAHSHGASFFSHCLSGAYSHEIWEKKKPALAGNGPNDGGSPAPLPPVYYETVRTTSSLEGSTFSESTPRRGNFTMNSELSHEHLETDTYFCDAAPLFHKVCVREKHLHGDPNITLVVRGKHATYTDSHFVTVNTPLADEVRTKSVTDFDHERAEQTLLTLVQARLSGADLEGGRPGGAFRVFAEECT